MSGILWLFSSSLERDAAFPQGVPGGLLTDTTGVGLVEAGIGSARAIDRHAPDGVIYVGTCGAFRHGGAAVGALAIPETVIILSGDAVRGEMRLPTLLSAREEADRALIERLRTAAGEVGYEGGTLACTFGITEESRLADLLEDASAARFENLEAFSVLRASGPIPCAVLLGITNIVGPGGGSGVAGALPRDDGNDCTRDPSIRLLRHDTTEPEKCLKPARIRDR